MKTLSGKWFLTLLVLSLLAAGAMLGAMLAEQVAYAVAKGTNTADRELLAELSKQDKLSGLFRAVAKTVNPAVVEIRVERTETVPEIEDFMRKFFDDEDVPFRFRRPRRDGRVPRRLIRGLGSGVIVDAENGYILTNNHIVENAVEIKIFMHNSDEFDADIIGTDDKTDLALLKVKAKNLPFAKLGDSDKLRVGEWVMAIGNPWGLDHSVTAGIVSAKGRQLDIRGGNTYQDYIQTDAAINRGNSGGPLVNMAGEVVGINSIIYSSTGGNIGIGFAISSNLAKTIVTHLKKHGRVIRGQIGIVGIYHITSDLKNNLGLATNQGALVGNIVRGKPAEKGGLKMYDVITKLDGIQVKDPVDFRFRIADTEPGTTVEFTVLRKGKNEKLEEILLKIKVEEMDTEEVVERGTPSGKDLGFSVDVLTSRIARRLGARIQEGLIVTEVRRYSEAAK